MIAAFLRGPLGHGTQIYMPRIALPEPEVEALAQYLAAVNRGEDVEREIAQQRQRAASAAVARE
jgi:hypothetical protein